MCTQRAAFEKILKPRAAGVQFSTPIQVNSKNKSPRPHGGVAKTSKVAQQKNYPPPPPGNFLKIYMLS